MDQKLQLHTAKASSNYANGQLLQKYLVHNTKELFSFRYMLAEVFLLSVSISFNQRSNSLKTLLTSTSWLESLSRVLSVFITRITQHPGNMWISEEIHTLTIMPFWQTHRKNIFFWTIHNGGRTSYNTGYSRVVLNQPQQQRCQHHLT